MKFIINILLISIFTLSGYAFTSSDNKNLVVVYTFDEENDERFNEFTKKDLKEIGYFLSDPHHRVNDTYEKKFGKTDLSLISFSSIMNESVVRPMLNKDPRLAGFSPFNLLSYRKKSDMKTVIAHLTPELMLDILEIDDKAIRDEYIASFKPLDDLIKEKLGGKKSYLPVKGRAEDTMINFEIPFDEQEDIDDFFDEFQEKFEYAFEIKGFVIAGFYDIKESFNNEEDVMPEFLSFWSYSLCHIPYSYAIFDGENAIPEAGIFAPCSMYIYVKKGENKIVMGMPTLSSWVFALGITQKDKLEYTKKLDDEIVKIIKSLGGKSMPNGNPLLSK
ncbi:MAG: hypothetical protein K8R44_05165 [Sulfurimonas sp.]|nr:hypothetical protein [Sulfurimonas sp.]